MALRSSPLLFGLSLLACGDNLAPPPAADAAPAEPDANLRQPARLAETGLYEDLASGTLAAGVRAYAPAFPLWSDGAAKRRFVKLPEGATIDSSDMSFWRYPVGTKLWKEFTVGDTRVETRLVWKRDAGDWLALSYAWDEDGTEAVAVPAGAENVLGTQHDIPDQNDCDKCHIRQPDYVLGFSALQLAHEEAGVGIAELAREGALSHEPSGSLAVPGDAVERAALGYLHGNCGGCHHPESDTLDTTDVILRLAPDELGSVEETALYTTSVGVPGRLQLPDVTALIEPGAPEASAIWVRMNTRGSKQEMPPVGSELVDAAGLGAVAAWIEALAQEPAPE